MRGMDFSRRGPLFDSWRRAVSVRMFDFTAIDIFDNANAITQSITLSLYDILSFDARELQWRSSLYLDMLGKRSVNIALKKEFKNSLHNSLIHPSRSFCTLLTAHLSINEFEYFAASVFRSSTLLVLASICLRQCFRREIKLWIVQHFWWIDM